VSEGKVSGNNESRNDLIKLLRFYS